MNVLSLFDGISVARVALDLAHIEVKNYYASEIEKNAISISKKNYPTIVRFGSVIDLCANMIPEPIDLLIGGSPCQDLSIAKKDRKGLEGERSGLFWQYIRIMNEVKPKYFILENVASMPQKDKDIITGIMGCEPILFNASLVSAQCRKRLFWTNIKFELPTDRHIILKDILQPPAEIDERMVNKDKKAYTLTATYNGATIKNSVERKQRTMVKVGHIGEIKEGKNHANEQGGQAHRVYDNTGISPTLGTTPPNVLIKVGTMGNSDSQGNRVYSPEGKSCTLSAKGGGLGSNTGLYKVEITKDPKENKGLFITDSNELAVVEGVKKGFTIVENYNSVDLSYANCKTMRRGRVGDKAKNLMTSNNIHVNQDFNVRKLTPIECERLQSLPDNYTEGIAMTNRYKCLGNAFNAEVIAHILKAI